MEASKNYDWKKADVLRKEEIFSWDCNGKRGAGDFYRACLAKWAEVHPENPRPDDANIVFQLLRELGWNDFVMVGAKEGEEIQYDDKTGMPSTSCFNKTEAFRAILLEIAYLFSFSKNRFPDTETIRGLWYLKQGFKQFSILLLNPISKYDGRRASQDLSATLSEMVESGSFEYLASFGIVDEGAWSETLPEKGFSNIVVCVEKDARAPKLVKAARCLGLKVVLSGGGRPRKAKTEDVWYTDLRDNCTAENPLYLLCIVDFDDSGESIVKNFEKQFRRYTEHIETIHVGVFPHQLPESELDPFESLYEMNAGKSTLRRIATDEKGNEWIEKASSKKGATWKRGKKKLSDSDKWILENAFRIDDKNDGYLYPYGIEIDVVSAARWGEILYQAIVQNTPFSSKDLMKYNKRYEGRTEIDCSDMVESIIEKYTDDEIEDPTGEIDEYNELQGKIDKWYDKINEAETRQNEIRDEIEKTIRPICKWVNAEVPLVDGRVAPDETPIWDALRSRSTSFYLGYENDNRIENAQEEFWFHYDVAFEGREYERNERPHYRPNFHSKRFNEFREEMGEKFAELIERAKRYGMKDKTKWLRKLKSWYLDEIPIEKPHLDQVVLRFNEAFEEAFEEWKYQRAEEIAEKSHDEGLTRTRAYQSILDWFSGNNRDPVSKAEIDEILDQHY